MKLAEMLDQLDRLRSKHGNIEVLLDDGHGQTVGIWGIEYNDDQDPEAIIILADAE